MALADLDAQTTLMALADLDAQIYKARTHNAHHFSIFFNMAKCVSKKLALLNLQTTSPKRLSRSPTDSSKITSRTGRSKYECRMFSKHLNFNTIVSLKVHP